MRIINRILQPYVHQRNRSFSWLSTRNFSIKTDDSEAEWNRLCQRRVPKTIQEMSLLLGGEVDSPPNAKLLKVAIIGVPNSGKSTLINVLMRWRVCSVSSKVHTTRINARAILNHGSTQLVFLDTPGLVTHDEVSRHGLERSLLMEAEKSLLNADLMAVVHDMSNHHAHNELHPTVLRLLALYPDMPSILILNKLDVLKSKRRLLDSTRLLTEGVVGGMVAQKKIEKTQDLDKEILIQKAFNRKQKLLKKESENTPPQVNGKTGLTESADTLENYSQLTQHEVPEFIKDRKGWPYFQDVFMISALKESGVDDLRNYLLSKAYSSAWLFSSEVVTDQNPEEIALMTVREKFLETFKNEIPYTVKFDIELWDVSESELMNISVQVRCRRKGLTQFIVGSGGFRIANVIREAEEELCRTFRTRVCLKINVVYDASMKKKSY
ncbi:GTPase Era, mitochondrial [Macrobrachium rosenbergii]|uniref:GTPase Era, mitochondrial n=1 Tax=Macrobrachium rosenbergii TaxID=79674 RepID=UPI0034D510BB